MPETRIEVEIPRIMTNLGKILHYVKLPNFLSVETRPYDNQTYEDEIDEDEVLDEEGRARLKLKVENTIRWRKKNNEDGTEATDELGKPIRESNARVVRWSDGSMSLHLGNEIFDVHTMPIQGDFNHLFVRQGTGLQGQSIFKTKLAFRPHSTESATHRKMTLSLADRSTKAQKVKVLPISGRDPDAHRSEMIKKEEEKLRASIRRESTRRRMKERSLHRGLNARYLEDGEDDDEGGVSLNDLKKEYKQKRADRLTIYSSASIKIRNYNGAARIVVTLVTNEAIPKPHAHKLVGKNCNDGSCVVELKPNQNVITFPNLCIQHVTRRKASEVIEYRILDSMKLDKQVKLGNLNVQTDLSDDEKSQASKQSKQLAKDMQLNVVRLCFQAYLRDDSGRSSTSCLLFCLQQSTTARHQEPML